MRAAQIICTTVWTPQPETLQRSVPGKGLGLAVWGLPEGLRNRAPRAGEQCATGWGVDRHGRGNPGESLVLQRKQGAIVGEGGRRRRRGRAAIGISLRMRWRALRGWCLWHRLWVARSYLLWLQETGHFLCRPQVAGNLLCGLRAAQGLAGCGASCVICRQQERTTVVVLEARGRYGLPPLGACEWAPPAVPVTSGVSKKKKKKREKKKEGTGTKHHTLLLSPSWEHTRPAAATAKGSGQRLNA